MAEPLKPAMHRAIAAEAFGKFVPLAAAAHAEDNAIENLTQVGPWSSGRFGWVAFVEDQLQTVPEAVRNFPDGVRWRRPGFPCHGRQLLSWSCLFRQVPKAHTRQVLG